jgi:hypothetical protein
MSIFRLCPRFLDVHDYWTKAINEQNHSKAIFHRAVNMAVFVNKYQNIVPNYHPQNVATKASTVAIPATRVFRIYPFKE